MELDEPAPVPVLGTAAAPQPELTPVPSVSVDPEMREIFLEEAADVLETARRFCA